MGRVDNNCAFSGPGPEPGQLRFQHVAMLARQSFGRGEPTSNSDVYQVTRTWLHFDTASPKQANVYLFFFVGFAAIFIRVFWYRKFYPQGPFFSFHHVFGSAISPDSI